MTEFRIFLLMNIGYTFFRIYNVIERSSFCSTNFWLCSINKTHAYLTGMVFWREKIRSYQKMSCSVNHTSLKTVMRNIHINGMQHSDIDIIVRIWFMRMFNHRRTRLHIYKMYLCCFYLIHCIHSYFFEYLLMQTDSDFCCILTQGVNFMLRQFMKLPNV